MSHTLDVRNLKRVFVRTDTPESLPLPTFDLRRAQGLLNHPVEADPLGRSFKQESKACFHSIHKQVISVPDVYTSVMASQAGRGGERSVRDSNTELCIATDRATSQKPLVSPLRATRLPSRFRWGCSPLQRLSTILHAQQISCLSGRKDS